MGHGDGPEMAGIDPGEMGGLVSKMRTGAETVDTKTSGLKYRFESHGVSTSNLTAIGQISTWVKEQLPMLQRRQSLAQQIVDEGAAFGGPGIWYYPDNGQGLGAFPTPEEARRAAQQLADKLKGVDPDGVPDEVYETLLQYANDPDFVAEFYERIGPEGVDKLRISANKDDYDRDHPYDERKLMAVGFSLATASYRLNLNGDWLDRVNAVGHKGSGNYANVTPFLKYGTWNKDTLKLIGERELTGAAVPMDPRRAADVWNAMARNPLASAEFYNEHFDLIQLKSQGADPMLRGDETRMNQEAWANMIESATVDARNVYFRMQLDDPSVQNLAEKNTVRTINYVKDHPDDHVFGALQETYGNIIKEYFDDLTYSVTSPVPGLLALDDPNRQGIELPKDAWGAFMREAMRDADTAGRLQGQFVIWMEGQTGEVTDDHQISRSDPESGNPLAWTNAQIGLMRQFFQYNYGTVYQEMVKEHEDWQEGVDGAIEKAIDWAFDPKGIAKDLAKTALTEAAKGIFHNLSEDDLEKLDTAPMASAAAWQRRANNHLDNGNIPPITVDGLTWEGDPGFYEELYGGRFTDSRGNIVDFASLPEDQRVKALRAYNEWLQDPAVVAAVEEGYFEEEGGRGAAANDEGGG